MTPWAAKLVQPAGGQVRIGVLQDHLLRTLPFDDYTRKRQGEKHL
jgi:hypothetical protein